VLQYAFEDFASRLPVVLQWLYVLYTLDPSSGGATSGLVPAIAGSVPHRYNNFLKAVLQHADKLVVVAENSDTGKPSISDAGLRTLLMEAPVLTQDCIGTLVRLCRDVVTVKMLLGLQYLKDLAEHRFPVRAEAMRALLSCTHDAFTALRTRSIHFVINDKVLATPVFRPIVEAHAVSACRRVITAVDTVARPAVAAVPVPVSAAASANQPTPMVMVN